MSNSIYASGIKNIFINNGIVNFELVTLLPNSKNELSSVFSGLLAMPLGGFLNLHDQMNGLVNKMVDEGVLKPKDLSAE
jgi:hypothetical protein